MPHPARFLYVPAALSSPSPSQTVTAQPQVRRTGGPGTQNRPVVAEFDADKDGRLNAAEREAARQSLGATVAGRAGGRFGGNRTPPSPGIQLTSSDVQHFPDAPIYDPATLRTFFIEFENADWEAEMVAFNNTDVDVPATVTVDGRVYRDVGVHFRGNSSFGVGNGYKRSLNLAFDFVHDDQAIGGYRTLNFLNANTDPTLMRTVLSMHIARQYIAAPKANFVRVVINGENWGCTRTRSSSTRNSSPTTSAPRRGRAGRFRRAAARAAASPIRGMTPAATTGRSRSSRRTSPRPGRH
jgi:hypothetical protein